MTDCEWISVLFIVLLVAFIVVVHLWEQEMYK